MGTCRIVAASAEFADGEGSRLAGGRVEISAKAASGISCRSSRQQASVGGGPAASGSIGWRIGPISRQVADPEWPSFAYRNIGKRAAHSGAMT